MILVNQQLSVKVYCISMLPPDINISLFDFIRHVRINCCTPSDCDRLTFENPSEPLCRKDTGKKIKIKWSRGHKFIVRGGGHIQVFQSLFK